jgi:hypothetical protein
VRALTSDDASEWSESRFFRLTQQPTELEVREALAVLHRIDTDSRGEPQQSAATQHAERVDLGSVAGSAEPGQPVALTPVEFPGASDEPPPSQALVAPVTATGNALVLRDGGIRFPDGSLLTRSPWPAGGLVSLRISGSTLRPRESDVSYTVSSSGGCVYVTAGDATTVFNTPLSLPNGVRVDTLRMYYSDTSAASTTGWFSIYDLYGTVFEEYSVSSTTSGGNSFNDSVQINHVIDQSVYSYAINWRPQVSGSSMQLCGFRVFYGY